MFLVGLIHSMLILISPVLGKAKDVNYCEFGLCDPDVEICCAENRCCDNTFFVHFKNYILGFVALVLICVVVAYCIRLARMKWKKRRTMSYTLLLSKAPLES